MEGCGWVAFCFLGDRVALLERSNCRIGTLPVLSVSEYEAFSHPELLGGGLLEQ